MLGHMRTDPVRQGEGPSRFRKGVARCSKHADADLTGLAIDDRHLFAGIVHELCRRRRVPGASWVPGASQSYGTARKNGYIIPIQMNALVFLPKDQQCHAWLLQLNRKWSLVGLLAQSMALFDAGVDE